MRAFRFGLGAAVALAEAAIATVLIFSSSHDDNPWLIFAFAITAGLSFMGAGLVALWRRPDNATGRYLAATGYLWFIAAFTEANNGWLWTFGFIAGNLAFVAFVALVLVYPDGLLSRRDAALVAVGGVVAVGVNLIVALTDEHPASGCAACPTNPLALVDESRVGSVALPIGTAVVVVVLALVVWRVVSRWRSASPTRRILLRPVFLSCALSMALLTVSVAIDQLSETAYGVTWLLFLATFSAVPLTFLWGVLRSRRARSTAASVLLSLETGTELSDTIARALGDPSLEIAYWTETNPGGWVDADGRRRVVPTESERSVAIVEREGRRIAALIYDPALDLEPEVVDSVTAAASFPLLNERLQAEAKAQYAFLETVADTAPSLLVVISTEGRIVNQNVATVRASGYEHEEMLRGRFFWDVFIAPEERDAVVGRFEGSAPHFPAAEYENTFTNIRGERRVIAWRSAPVPGPDGKVESIVAGGIDITERYQREQELQRERDAMTTVLQAIPSLIVVLDRTGVIVDRDTDNPIAAVNRAFRETLGWRDEQLVGRALLDFLDPLDLGSARAAIDAAAEGRFTNELESSWRCENGTSVAVAWRAAPVTDVTGRTSGLVLVTGMDVTDRLKHEEEVRASRARLVAAGDDARRRLERNLHDGAQQRLVALAVSLRLAESRLSDDPSQAASILAASRDELAQALEELRELARGIHPAVLTDRGLAAAVDALVNRSPVVVDAQVTPETLDPAVAAAAYYVISEALTNVVKYAEAESVSVRVETDNGLVTVSVDDDGIGGAAPMNGTGLRGLADRIAALDGTLSIESPPAQGTRVTATIPVRHSPSASEGDG